MPPLVLVFFVGLLAACSPVVAGEGADRAPLVALGVAVLLLVALTVYQRLNPGGSFDDGDVLQEALDRVDSEIAMGLRDPPGLRRCPHCRALS